jgi:hypothetical protein
VQFGSVFKMKPKAGKKQALIDSIKTRSRPEDVKGFVIAHVFDAGDEVWGVAIFANEKVYRDNGNDPATDQEYRQMASSLNLTRSGTTAWWRR